MKQFFTLILATIISVAGYAQSETLEQALARISNLEATVNSQSQQLAKISSDLDAVLAQNLALKKNLKLKPTIAKSVIADAIDFRILEVTGDKSTGRVHVLMSVENIGDDEVRLFFKDNEILDELGNGYDTAGRWYMKVNGVSDNIHKESLNLHKNAPYKIDLYIKNFNQDAGYIKYLGLKMNDMAAPLGANKNRDTSFQNLPIKWVEEIEE